jgi:hypothetical protein
MIGWVLCPGGWQKEAVIGGWRREKQRDSGLGQQGDIQSSGGAISFSIGYAEAPEDSQADPAGDI